MLPKKSKIEVMLVSLIHLFGRPKRTPSTFAYAYAETPHPSTRTEYVNTRTPKRIPHLCIIYSPLIFSKLFTRHSYFLKIIYA